jgi:DNA-binding SARP family transcriptional activator
MTTDTGVRADEGTVVHLFDGPFVTIGSCKFTVPEGSKRLLAYVALRQGRVERRRAAGALWPIGDDHRAAGNLRSALWRLRGAGIDVMNADKWSMELCPGVQVDAQLTLEWASRLIADTVQPGDLAMRGNRIDALDLLPGWYEDWAIVERERIRQRMLHALEVLSRRFSEVGRHAEAVEVAMAVVNAEPLRESAQRVLLEAHATECNWVEVRRSYLCYRDLVRRELGVEPAADLTRFVQQTRGIPARVQVRQPAPLARLSSTA